VQVELFRKRGSGEHFVRVEYSPGGPPPPPAPYTLHPLPHTLHPTPYTLHLTPCTLHPASYTLHPTPYTLHPTPCTLHPTPYTLHPTPYTLHPTPFTLHPTPYTEHPAPYMKRKKVGPGIIPTRPCGCRDARRRPTGREAAGAATCWVNTPDPYTQDPSTRNLHFQTQHLTTNSYIPHPGPCTKFMYEISTGSPRS